jgi:hypothetical protein
MGYFGFFWHSHFGLGSEGNMLDWFKLRGNSHEMWSVNSPSAEPVYEPTANIESLR